MTAFMPADRHSRTASTTPARSGSARPTSPRNSNANSRGESGQLGPACVARATPNTRRPAEAIASMDCVSAARSAHRAGKGRRSLRARPWWRQRIPAGRRPVARYGLRPGDRAEGHRRAPASSSGARYAASVSCSRARVWNARSIGSNGSGALASKPNSLKSRNDRRHFRSVARTKNTRHPRAAARRLSSGSR